MGNFKQVSFERLLESVYGSATAKFQRLVRMRLVRMNTKSKELL